jgi:hypothetical protein
MAIVIAGPMTIPNSVRHVPKAASPVYALAVIRSMENAGTGMIPPQARTMVHGLTFMTGAKMFTTTMHSKLGKTL